MEQSISEEMKHFLDSYCTQIEGNSILDTKIGAKTKVFRYKDYVFPDFLLYGHFESLKLNFKQEDIIVTSFPKTGTTWVQELVYLVHNDGDLNKADSIPPLDHCPFLEMLSLCSMSIDEINADQSPKVFKSHLPYALLPETSDGINYKIVYVCRNPKDTVVSLYHFYRMLNDIQFTGSFSEMVELFTNDLVMYSPFGRHVLDFWERSKTDDNILFLKYEDLHQDVKAGIRQIAEFLGKTLDSNQIEQIAQRCSFKSMSGHQIENDKLDTTKSKFFRKGIVGDWRNHFNEEDNRKMDNWIEKTFGNTDLKFNYD